MSIDRLVPPTPESKMFGAAVHILSLHPPGRVDAIIVLQGQGEWWRVADAATYRNQFGSKYFMLAAFNTTEKTSKMVSEHRLFSSPYSLRDRSNIIIGEHADHTPAQAAWIADHLRNLDIRTIGLVVSDYHIVRGYLTVLKPIVELGKSIQMYAVPSQAPPSWLSPERGVAMWDMVHGEAERIIKYQAKGDIATYEQLRAYMDGFWPIPKYGPTE